MKKEPGKSSESDLAALEAQVLDVVRALLAETGENRALSFLSSDASLDRDLGLGSLERVELLLRLEERFSLRLPDTVMAEAHTPHDLARAILRAEPRVVKIVHHRLPSLEEAEITSVSAETLNEVLTRRSEINPKRPHVYLFLEDGRDEVITYRALLQSATAIAVGLMARGLERGETVAIMLPTGETFFHSFFGVLLAGGIPVPVYPPFRPDRIAEYAERQSRILENAGARFLVTFQEAGRLARLLKPRLTSLRDVVTPEELAVADAAGRSQPNVPPLKFVPNENDPALIQYTSGSTGAPKGVVLTHRNLLSNIKSIGSVVHLSPTDAGVSWLPLYHDMGLIGSWLFCLYYGIPITILPPFAFLKRPERWLWAIHTHRATLSPAPNFAYEICARKIKDEEIKGLDLSSWRVAFNGAEPVSPETLARFTRRFAPYGFRPETFAPVYGLAESSVALTCPHIESLPRIDRVSREAFERDRKAVTQADSEPSPLEFVSCGQPIPDHQVRIIDDNGKTVGERMEGRVEFRGPSCTEGYYRNPEETASLRHDGWLISGDLGYWANGELFITGRKKDVIIKSGRNLYPHEIEEVVGDIAGIRKGCVAAFGTYDKGLSTEKLVVVAETKEAGRDAVAALNATINERIVTTLGIPPDQVLLVPPGTVPKTSSGKIARAACREAFLGDRLSGRRPKVQVQLASLAASWLWSWTRRGIGGIGRLVYGAYLGLTLGSLILPIWALVSFLPVKQAERLLKGTARLFLKLAGCFPCVEGAHHLYGKGPMILVANHASYVDAGVLTAVLQTGVRFVAKQELLKLPIVRTFLLKGGHLLVDRADVSKGASDTQKIGEALRSGASVLIFPEGTFGPVERLFPF
ncbi:MAG: AMP-binding protein, partial [Nitrospiria bacterium]